MFKDVINTSGIDVSVRLTTALNKPMFKDGINTSGIDVSVRLTTALNKPMFKDVQRYHQHQWNRYAR